MTYSWTEKSPVPQGKILSTNLSDSGKGLELAVKFQMDVVSSHHVDMMISFLSGEKVVEIQIVTDVDVNTDCYAQISTPQETCDGYKIFLTGENWGYCLLLTETTIYHID